MTIPLYSKRGTWSSQSLLHINAVSLKAYVPDAYISMMLHICPIYSVTIILEEKKKKKSNRALFLDHKEGRSMIAINEETSPLYSKNIKGLVQSSLVPIPVIFAHSMHGV